MFVLISMNVSVDSITATLRPPALILLDHLSVSVIMDTKEMVSTAMVGHKL